MTRFIKIDDYFKKRLKIINAVLIIFSSFITLISAEFVLANIYPQKTLKFANVYSPFCFRKSTYLPFQLKANAKCIQIQEEFEITVNTNSHGYRNPEFSIKKPNQIKRLIMLGDSFAFGYGIEDKQVLSRILEEKLNQRNSDWEVINAAYASGDSPDSYYAYLINEGFRLNPDVIIEMLFVGNDFTDLFETKWLETDKSGLPVTIETVDRFIDGEGRLLHPSLPINYRLPILKNSHPFCIYNLECIKRDLGLSNNVDKILKLPKAKDILAQENRAEYILVIIPSDMQIYSNAWKKWGESVPFEPDVTDQPQSLLREFLDEQEIEYIDLLPVFRNSKDRLYYPKDAHFNERGHEKTAEIIVKYLLES
jgi:hypothetical protein